MAFSSLSSYQLTLLFSSWNIEHPWQFVIAWFFVFLASIFYIYMKVVLSVLEEKIWRIKNNGSGEAVPLVGRGLTLPSSNSQIKLRVMHAVLNSSTYGLALLLMLVAMTYNSALFLALVLGYGVGDFIFFAEITLNERGTGDCH